jgi:hypothetical protein
MDVIVLCTISCIPRWLHVKKNTSGSAIAIRRSLHVELGVLEKIIKEGRKDSEWQFLNMVVDKKMGLGQKHATPMLSPSCHIQISKGINIHNYHLFWCDNQVLEVFQNYRFVFWGYGVFLISPTDSNRWIVHNCALKIWDSLLLGLRHEFVPHNLNYRKDFLSVRSVHFACQNPLKKTDGWWIWSILNPLMVSHCCCPFKFRL